MNNNPINQEEAAASLKEIEKVMFLTRRIIAQGSLSKSLVLWGVIWVIGYGTAPWTTSFTFNVWLILGIIGWFGEWMIRRCYPSPVKNLQTDHRWKIPTFYLLLFFYAYLWAYLLAGPTPKHHSPMARGLLEYNRMAAYCATICMFAYVMVGLWFSRFFLWLGGIVTILALVGYLFLFDYFNLWMAFWGGGSLIMGGVFMQKFWK